MSVRTQVYVRGALHPGDESPRVVTVKRQGTSWSLQFSTPEVRLLAQNDGTTAVDRALRALGEALLERGQ